MKSEKDKIISTAQATIKNCEPDNPIEYAFNMKDLCLKNAEVEKAEFWELVAQEIKRLTKKSLH